MIPFVDVAFGAFLKSLFLGYPVVFTPPELARQGLARSQESRDVGIPGVAYWRVGVTKDKRIASLPQAQQGFNAGRQNGSKFQIVKYIKVKAQYTVVAWSRDLSILNHIERTLAFADVYQTVHATIRGVDDQGVVNFEAPCDFPIEGDDPLYKQVPDEKSGKISWFSLEKNFSISTQWMDTADAPWIDEILVKVYKGISEGIPLERDLLEIIEISRDGIDVERFDVT